jgi:outer membrane protein, heavy metal efflux system
MVNGRVYLLVPSLLLVVLSGCVGVSRVDGERSVERELRAATPLAPPLAPQTDSDAGAARVAELIAAPLTPESAVQLAFLRNPKVPDAMARLGLSQADVVAASRIANPILSGSLITGQGERQVTGEIALSLTELLLLSARKRLATGEYQRAQELVASSLGDLVRDTEAAWYRCASTEQLSAMRSAIAHASQTSAELAQRFYDAGNISELDLTLVRAAAAQAQVQARRAALDVDRAKYELQQLMGLAGAPQWQVERDLPAPVAIDTAPDALVALAREHRADLRAARAETELLADVLAVVRRWRWLGTVEVGAQREREPDTHVLTGPTLALALPIFDQGQAGIARATAQLEASRARLKALETAVDNGVRLGLERVTVSERVAADFRQALIPQHELIVRRQQELQSFMLIGQFELLLSKQQEYDAYQGYLEAVRDYWLARVDLARQRGSAERGGRCPGGAGGGGGEGGRGEGGGGGLGGG